MTWTSLSQMLKRPCADSDGFRKSEMWTHTHPGLWAHFPALAGRWMALSHDQRTGMGQVWLCGQGPILRLFEFSLLFEITRRWLGWGAWASLICMRHPGPDTIPPACTRWTGWCRGGLPWNREEGLNQHPLHRLTASVSCTAQDSVQLALPLSQVHHFDYWIRPLLNPNNTSPPNSGFDWHQPSGQRWQNTTHGELADFLQFNLKVRGGWLSPCSQAVRH